MLQLLRISNFALIDEVQINFNEGYTVITGETGSGKSILLNALNLILGERADFSVIGTKNSKASVEAEFTISEKFRLFFEEHDLDFETNLIVRREISKEGKSRCFINDTPVQLSVLRNLTVLLIQIHSQYNTLELKSKSYQLELLDILAGLEKERTAFSADFKELSNLNRLLAKKQGELSNILQAQDYNLFVLSELKSLRLDAIDYSFIESELSRMENSENLKAVFLQLISLTDENGIFEQLQAIKGVIDKNIYLDTNLNAIKNRLDVVLLELKDLSNDALRHFDNAHADPKQLVELTTSLDAFNSALSKHRVQDQEQLKLFEEDLRTKVETVAALNSEVEQVTKNVAQLEKLLREKATILHEKRTKAEGTILSDLQGILLDLKLPHTKLDFNLSLNTELNSFGLTNSSFLFSANYGFDPIPIEKAASGGELSRLMLALQKLVSEKRDLPTILFDEIDTGVSGEVAQKIGVLLKQMGAKVQLIAISHLPQVAAKAEHHLLVSKELENKQMKTNVEYLYEQDRINEIARLMSGEKITDAAKLNAQNLISN
jgi:DNA repair protein RecN (Recombination protein N)